MDLGLLRALGLGALSLRPLVLLWQLLGVVARACLRRLASPVGSGLCVLLWFWIWRRWLRLWVRWIQWVAADRSSRPLLSLVWTVSWVLQHGERDQHN